MRLPPSGIRTLSRWCGLLDGRSWRCSGIFRKPWMWSICALHTVDLGFSTIAHKVWHYTLYVYVLFGGSYWLPILFFLFALFTSSWIHEKIEIYLYTNLHICFLQQIYVYATLTQSRLKERPVERFGKRQRKLWRRASRPRRRCAFLPGTNSRQIWCTLFACHEKNALCGGFTDSVRFWHVISNDVKFLRLVK